LIGLRQTAYDRLLPLLLTFTACFSSSAQASEGQAYSNGRVAVSADGTQRIEIHYAAQPPLSDPRSGYPGLQPGTTILPIGFTTEPGRRPFTTDTIYEQDVAIRLRDGTVIYADVYRPAGKDRVPAIVSYGPAGKRGMNNMLDRIGGGDGIPQRLGLPRAATSGRQAWESPDPAAWVPDGYAVVNVDVRGTYMSGGDLQLFGSQNAEDGYDVIEFLAAQPWCNGKLGMNGNSWYAIVQWAIAALRPPHLAAIAPWEGEFDVYRDEYVRDGIPMKISSPPWRAFGPGRIEDYPLMIAKYPLKNAYWDSKVPQLEEIIVPAYVVASYGSQIHTRGTFEAFNRISSPRKWLRVHDTNEWLDLYSEASRRDLRDFFDRYLRNINNRWENTPRVRLALLDPGHQDLIGLPAAGFPLPDQKLERLHLDANTGRLSHNVVSTAGQARYKADDGAGRKGLHHTLRA
jgi:uncharacterized protein